MSRSRTCRPFAISDAMILTAATAVGFVAFREYLPLYLKYRSIPSRDRVFELLVYGPGFLALPWMIALLGLRMKQPRPRIRRLAREPGVVACAAALAAAICGGLNMLFLNFWRPYWRDVSGIWPWDQMWYQMTHYLAPSLIAAWLALAISGRWRANAGWTDRSGRAIGAYFVARFLLSHGEQWLIGLLPSF